MSAVRFTVCLLLIAGAFLFVVAMDANAAAPPRPDAHPSACKKKAKRCVRTVRRPVTYEVTWRVDVDPGDGSAPYSYTVRGTCTIPVKGPETCSITVSW